MRPDQLQLRVSSVGVALFVVSLARRERWSRRVMNNPCRERVAGGLLGLYLLFCDPRGRPVGEGRGAALRANTSGCAVPGCFTSFRSSTR